MPDKPIPLIYNPAAGGGAGTRRYRDASRLLEEAGITVEGVETVSPGHATEIAANLARNHKVILAVGGDGTLSEVANGVLDSGHDVTLGFLPAGTGNDFLRDFGVKDREEAVRRIAAGVARPVDAVHVSWNEGTEHRWSINTFGTGFMAKVGDTTNRRLKWMGSRGYTAAVLMELARLRNVPTRLELDGKELPGRYVMVACCNTIHTGGAMKMAPAAVTDDGLLDVLVLERIGRAALLKLFPRIFSGKHVEHPKVHEHRARHVRIEPDKVSPLLVDGDVVGHTPVELQVHPGALRVLV